jgi:hypothetical protein
MPDDGAAAVEMQPVRRTPEMNRGAAWRPGVGPERLCSAAPLLTYQVMGGPPAPDLLALKC